MRFLLYTAAALAAYLIGGWNPAIAFSNLIYQKDIRECGSGNAGFTNFKRTFGSRWAWWVLALDLTKAAVVELIFAALFGRYLESSQFGAAYTGLFAVLGHCFPLWYGFKGGKGFLVTLSTAWIVDWRVGLAATLLMIVLLLTTKYMSLSTVCAMLSVPFLLAAFGTPWSVWSILALMALLMAVRHRENFKRLRMGTESKFTLRDRATAQTPAGQELRRKP